MYQGKVKLLHMATYSSVFVAIFLLMIKAIAWFSTDSVSIQASLVDSFVDSFASLINFFALRHALLPADNEHRFGHGKIEALAAQGQSVFIAITALWIIYEAIKKIIYPIHIKNTGLGMIVIIITIVLSLAIVIFQRYVVAKTNSTLIKADSLHFRGDLFLNFSVLITLIIQTSFPWPYFDPICGLLIGFYIAYTSWQISKESINILIDREISDENKERIKSIVLNHNSVKGMHDFKTRSSGAKKFIQLHIEMDPNITLKKAHGVTKEVLDNIMKVMPDAEVIIHQDICNDSTEKI